MRPEIAQKADSQNYGPQRSGREKECDPQLSVRLEQLMMLPASMPPAFLAVTGLADRLVRSLTDTTFTGIHQLGWFDYSLLIPYFGTLAILSVYGLHRYDMIRTYYQMLVQEDIPGAIGKMKQFASWFTHGVRNGAVLRRGIQTASDTRAVLNLVDDFFNQTLPAAQPALEVGTESAWEKTYV